MADFESGRQWAGRVGVDGVTDGKVKISRQRRVVPSTDLSPPAEESAKRANARTRPELKTTTRH